MAIRIFPLDPECKECEGTGYVYCVNFNELHECSTCKDACENEIKTYPEMDKKIIGLLEKMGDPVSLYAAIKSLEVEVWLEHKKY